MASNEHAPHAGSGPGGELLLAAHLLLEAYSEHVPVDEARVTRALEAYQAPDLETADSWELGLNVMLRTATYYILDGDQASEAVMSMPPAMPTFPPLPFRRVWIEMRLQRPGEHPRPVSYGTWVTREDNDGVDTVSAIGVAISEVVRGREWQIYIPFRRVKTIVVDGEEQTISDQGLATAFHVTPHEILSPRERVKQGPWQDYHLKGILQLAINGAHLITARSVPHREIVLPRHQRKRLQRERWAPRTPKLYYVDLSQAGEVEEGAGRIYRVRWMVQGHWRHLEHADDLCTCWEHRYSPRPATYIEPYAKGPPGAPWKGRPVHRQ